MERKDDETIGLKTILVNYLLHWKLILGVGIFTVILAILYLLLYPKTFETMARVQIQDENSLLSSGSLALGEAAGLMKSFGLGGLSSGSIVIDDEIATFTSNSILSEMIYKLGLYAEYTKPYSFYRLYKEKPLVVTADSTTLYNLDYVIKFAVSVSPGKVNIKAKIKTENWKGSFQFNELPAVVKMEQGEFIFDHTDMGRANPDYKMNVTVRPLNAVADDLVEEFTIEELSKTSNVIEFLASDYEKQRTKDMFNLLIVLYNERAKEYKNELGARSMVFLDERINNILSDLAKVELDIEDYKSKNRITMVESDVQYYVEYMKDLQMKLIEAEAQSHVIKLMDAFVKDTANQYKIIPSLFTSGQESENNPLALYNQALLERERLIRNSSGMDNPLIGPVTLQIEKLREGVHQMINNSYQSAQLVIKELKDKEASLFSRMGEVPAQERVYINYKRQQEILQGIYLILLQKREETVLALAQSKEKAKIIDPAFTMPRPVAPRKLYAAIGIVLLTLVITVGWIYGKEQLNDLIREFQRVKK
ncbi:tyrosine-protein kinase Etk/Wzc [Parabacteroides sp. PF5-5]|uniref:GumC family protein n=1 Tax=unclassified Parabacteroides TaxID=2649774 RepID=UPI00247511E9|nr:MULTISPECIES: Wzz/FepE/Etk N-terminal domain-containing protein [unclassified Parabacteroides]MDH6306153.1 tyrosine-protein kinase Etk/Wzc [Parabacteroides sp. PH5-39]MDH6317112.1 tyrosine-protein kinase Etk/Wzc [Parabacteroides sp. PF5-13]MDH6320865.1 tyrosine-protein kinase Etk/Wzc [Parabacteroides sp. PH5-13]MDH6324596.1 tyrosine-protein kinase Etk/Wzc [Parabacteroides sp. PH5-8]MDH6328353.1 tyrosine-protein kinase Etk/Wzc [Parabacteroides sp. PH5-41]